MVIGYSSFNFSHFSFLLLPFYFFLDYYLFRYFSIGNYGYTIPQPDLLPDIFIQSAVGEATAYLNLLLASRRNNLLLGQFYPQKRR